MIDPIIQKRIDKLMALARNAGTVAESETALKKASELRKIHTKPDPIEDDLDDNIGFHFKEDGIEKEIRKNKV